MMVFLVIAATAMALVIGALWGLYGQLSKSAEGLLVALAGGALIVSVMSELLQPASKNASLLLLLLTFLTGAVLFTLADLWIDRRIGKDSGGGLLAAIVMDGIPENLALGVVLITVEPLGALALAGSIFLSNLPEAAGSARQMRDKNWSKTKVLLLWTATAAILSAAALGGYVMLSSVQQTPLALIQGFAAGAVTASLATEVFPKAYEESHEWTGLAVAVGVAIAFALHMLG